MRDEVEYGRGVLIGVESEPVKRGNWIGFWHRLSINKLTTGHSIVMVGGDLFRLLGELERFAPVGSTSLYVNRFRKKSQCTKCKKWIGGGIIFRTIINREGKNLMKYD